MYRCELCALVPEFNDRGPKVQGPRERAVKVTWKTRPAEYPSRPKAQKVRAGRRSRNFDDPGGAGFEIAKEVLACPRCALDFEAMKAANPEDYYEPDPELTPDPARPADAAAPAVTDEEE